MARLFIPHIAGAVLLWGLSASCAAQVAFPTNPTQFLVCDKGTGEFHGKLPDFSKRSGVTVTVRATKKAGFAVRGCEASLNWGRGETIVGSNLAAADIDIMGADLGFGIPVVAFQIKATDADPTVRYEIYSLNKPPKLLHTITGQDYFSAADTRLDGTVEIWTTDSAAINGFDNLPLRAFDTPPSVVLRFENEKLIDVSSEFRPHFDQQISKLRSQLGDQQLSDFKASDGKLSTTNLAPDGQPGGLLATKIKVLEIVWAYLNSGREQQAWEALDKMWPAVDAERVRAAITAARKRGLRSQVDAVSQLTEPKAQANSSHVYANTSFFGGFAKADWERAKIADTGPEQILLRLPSPNNPEHWNDEKELELVVDEAGKVRSARMAGGVIKEISAGLQEPNQDWLDLAGGWKYIPAFKDGHPQAFRSKLHVLRDR